MHGSALNINADRGEVRPRFAARRPQRSPDRQASLDRRRTLAGQVMPPTIRTAFSEGERAVMAVIAGEVKRCGVCEFPIDRIAALAGVGRTTAKNAMRKGAEAGLLRVTARPQRGRKNLTNVVEIVSDEWRVWIKRGPAIGVKASTPTKNTGLEQQVSKKSGCTGPDDSPTTDTGSGQEARKRLGNEELDRSGWRHQPRAGDRWHPRDGWRPNSHVHWRADVFDPGNEHLIERSASVSEVQQQANKQRSELGAAAMVAGFMRGFNRGRA